MICKKAKEKLKEREKRLKEEREEIDCFSKGVCPKCGSENVDEKKEVIDSISYKLSYKCKDCNFTAPQGDKD